MKLSIALFAGVLWAQQGFVANYDEAKVGSYTLPDPLKFADGRAVKSAGEWRSKRRPEIMRLFEQQVYGKTPPARKIEYEVTSRDRNALGGSATRDQVTVWITGSRQGPAMKLLIYKPNKRSGPVPVFLGPNFGGNQTVNADPGIDMSKSWMRPGKGVENHRATEATRGAGASRWHVEKVLARGFATATLYYGDIFPDHAAGRPDSIIPYFQKEPAPDDWNAIGAWAYGLSRALDYIEKDKDLDAKRVAVHGHSRLGKTALWAGAQDERFAIVISNDSGEGGAALARRTYGETVERINTSFPHWFNANFKQFNMRVADLPVDQHMLIALIAPRPVYVASAVEDKWADPRGEFLSALGADPVYRLLGTDGLAAKEMPGIHQPVVSRIGYHIRAGVHDVTEYDWEQFMNFADHHFGRKK